MRKRECVMISILFITGATLAVVALIACQLKAFKEKHPNAELLAKAYKGLVINVFLIVMTYFIRIDLNPIDVIFVSS
jgi:hypothetical protein